MRKLKVLLITLFAACLSFTLFACGGGGGDEENKTLNRVSGSEIQLTDSDTSSTFTTKMETYTLTGRNEDGENVKIFGKDCDISGADKIPFGEIDSCTITFTPKENNENGVKAEVTVTIDHDWGAADADGKQVCAHDKATKITKDEDVAIHYGGFHYGTGIGATGQEAGAAEAVAKANLTAEDAATLGLNAEVNADNAIFNAESGINGDKTSSGRIKAFGADESAKGRSGLNTNIVPTLTAGDLIPGMSITIEGYAKTNAGASNTATGGEWNVLNQNWNCPSYGIADPYATSGQRVGYKGGNAVIVRSEGWVLYNGIGQENNNVLGGLPADIVGGGAYNSESGSTDKSNCASWDKATADMLNGQDLTNRPAYTSADWKDWWVYSEGQDRHSLDSYQTYAKVRVTWSYYTYGEKNNEVGIIIIDSDYEDTTFRSYIKVPAATRNAYRTIIHGDYSTLIITKSSVVETETVTGMQINDLKADATKEYLAGEQIDAGAVFNMQVTSEQNPTMHDSGIALTNDMLYYYNAGTDYDTAKADTDATHWTQVGDNLLTPDMKIFKVVLERTDKTFTSVVPKAASDQIKITPNNIAAAYGDAYADNIDSRDPMATYTRTLGVDGTTRYVDLTIDKALFRAVDAAAKDALGIDEDAAEYRYATIRLVGITAFGTFSATTGDDTNDTGDYYYAYQEDDNGDVLLAVAITEDMLGHEFVIDLTGAQETDIRLKFGTTSVGFDASSTATYTAPTLNAGGTVTVTYTNHAFAGGEQLAVWSGTRSLGSDYIANIVGVDNSTGEMDNSNIKDTATGELNTPAKLGDSGVTVTHFKADGNTTTVTFTFPAFDLASWTEMPRIVAMNANNASLTENYVEYSAAFTTVVEAEADTHKYQSEAITGNKQVYFYEQDGTLYFVTAGSAEKGRKVDLEHVTGGCTVNINDGDETKAKSFDLSYAYKNGLAFKDSVIAASEGFGLKVIQLTKAYGDYGYIVVASVAITATGFTGDFGFQIAQATSTAHYWKYDADAQGNKLSYAEVPSGAQQTVITKGDCYKAGIVASKVTDGNNTVFLAGYMTVGGQHVDATPADGKCDLCGATITGNVEMKDWNDGFTGAAYTITPGTIVDATGSLKANGVTDVGGNFGPFVSILVPKASGGNTRYWLRTDGCNIKHPNDSWEGTIACYPGNVDALGADIADENFYTSLSYNTLNGAMTTDGTAIDTTAFGDYIAGKSFRYIVSFIGTTIKVEFNYYNPDGTLSISYYVEIRNVEATSATAQFISDELTFLQNDGKITVTQSSVNKSVVDEIVGADVTASGTTYTASTAKFEMDGYDVDGNAKVAVTGMADKEGQTYYLAFKVKFSQALAETTTAALFQANGTTAFTGGYVDLNEARTELDVYVPVTATTGSFIIKFSNFKASTMQSDIVVDLAQLAVSDVSAALDVSALTLGETEFTLAYTDIQGTDELTIGSWKKALSAISTTTAEAITGTNLKVKANAAIAGGAVTLTFTKAAADITAQIPDYEIKLMRGTALVAINEVAPATKPAANDQQIGETGWYVRANGTKLYLFGNSRGTASLPFNVNAGHVTDKEMLGAADLSFSIVDGEVKFKNYSVLRAAITTVFTENGTANSLTVFIIDLTALDIAADTVYGFAIESNPLAHNDGYYTVAAGSGDNARTITPATDNLSAQSDVSIQTHDATKNGLTARFAGNDKDTATYYGYVTVTGHTFPPEGGACVCGTVGWQKDNVQVGKPDNTVNIGDGAHGNEKAYNPDVTERFHVLVKGMTIVAEGTLTSNATANANGVGAYLYPATQTTHNWDFFRIDNWINVGADGQDQEKAIITDWQFNVAKRTEIIGVTPGSDPWPTINQIKANAHAIITWDWSSEDGKTIILTFRITNLDMNATFIDEYTITSTAEGGTFAADKYAIGLTPILGSFTGSITASGPASIGADVDKCNPQLHTHSYDPDTDRCECGELKPGHVHSYDSTTYLCKCGALNPQHTHVYENGVCKYCESVQSATALTDWTVVDKTVSSPSVWNTVAGEVPEKLAKGGKLYVAGSMTQNFANHDNAPYYSMVLEFAEGYTFTIWNNGWVFPGDAAAEANFGAAAHALTRMTVYDNSHTEVEGLASETNMMAIAANCDYIVEFDWTTASKVAITVRLTANDRTYVISYDLNVKNAELTTLTARIGADHCDSVVIAKSHTVAASAD